MVSEGHPDAVVVGSGPNGLAAAIELARAGLAVLVCEAHERPGGGMRTDALTEPGFSHDVCSAAHPLAVASPFLRSLDLAGAGVELLHAPTPLAHPLDGVEPRCWSVRSPRRGRASAGTPRAGSVCSARS